MDLKNDRINVTIRLRKPFAGASLENLNLAVGVDFETSDVIPSKMKAAALISASNAR